MKTVTIFRTKRGDQGTEGLLSAPGGFTCYTLELPWRDNKSRISCIPAGTYIVRIRRSRKYGTIYHLTDVKGRTYILSHWGNWAGDITKGYRTHSAGCLLLGRKRGWLLGQRAILYSRVTVRKFMSIMQNETHRLQIIEAF